MDKYIYIVVFVVFSVGVYMTGMFDGLLRNLRRRRLVSVREKRRKIKIKIDKSSFFEKKRQRRINREIYEGLSVIRNIAATKRGKESSSEYIISFLAGRKGLLQKSYYEMLLLMRLGKKQEAENVIRAACRNSIGEGYAAILANWEYTDKEDLKQVVISFQKSVEEMNITEERKREEILSDLIYIPAMLNILIVFVNFIYTGFYTQQKELLGMFF